MSLLKKNGGFTLVELIVVIAILAILAGVAVPAYSGYVDKANQSADITLVRDVENALTLAMYGGTIKEGESGYVTLSTSGVSVTGTNTDAAMKAVFGDNYADGSVKLTYDKWGSSGMANSITPDEAVAVYTSSYMTGNRKDALLSDVEKMTGMAQNLVTAMSSSGGITETTLSSLFGEETLSATASKYGITLAEGETWDEWGKKAENATAYSNLLVLTVADEMEANRNNGTDMSAASDMVLEFSSYYAFAAQKPEFSKELDSYLDQLNDGSVTKPSEGKTWYDNLKAAADKYGYAEYVADAEGQIEADEYGFQSIMAGLGNPTAEQAANIAGDLNNANLFTEGVVNSMYNDYLTAIDVMVLPAFSPGGSMQQISIGTGEVAIMFSNSNGAIRVSNSLPTK